MDTINPSENDDKEWFLKIKDKMEIELIKHNKLN